MFILRVVLPSHRSLLEEERYASFLSLFAFVVFVFSLFIPLPLAPRASIRLCTYVIQYSFLHSHRHGIEEECVAACGMT